MPRSLVSALAILLIGAIGAALWIFVIGVRPEPLPAPPRQVGPSPVETRRLARQDYPVEVEVFGTLLAARRAVLAAERSGRVTWVREDWRSGLELREGDELLRIDAEPFSLELARAEAALAEAAAGRVAAAREHALSLELRARGEDQLEIAQRELSRLEALEVRGSVAASLVDQARSVRVSAEVELGHARGRVSAAEISERTSEARETQATTTVALARTSLQRIVTRAPFDGRLEGRAPAIGSYLVPGSPIAECLDLSVLHLVANVHADRLAAMREGLPVRIHLPSRPGLALEGRVRSVSSAVDPTTRSAVVEIEFENQLDEHGESGARGLPAGLFVRATIRADRRRNVLWIDRRHLVWRGEQATAWVLIEGREARVRVLGLGESLGEGYAIHSGLEVGEELITGPLDRLVDGAPCLRATNERATSERGAAVE